MKRLLIANRGEITCRIIRTARSMGIETVAVFSAADAEARHVRLADIAVPIGPAPSSDSYLRIDRILDAARASGADAVHPGYGFLSENADFAQAVIDAGLIFVGPGPDAIRAMGSKRAAKALVAQHGVPVLPGYQGEDQSEARLIAEGRRIGLPLMVKASAGGGGKGLRLVTDAADLPGEIARARAEALASFGDGELILERALVAPRHVEVQVFGDTHGNLIHLGERDCSLQRRHQKVIEEAPSPVVTPELRVRMGAAAIAAARAVNYHGAGTIEFLLDTDGAFWFMEMNTRLQVEHPVTEAITGLDLVEWQIRVARGEPLPLTQDQVTFSGHAIEARLYAEDAWNGFLPQTGPLLAWAPAPGARTDHGLAEGQPVTAFYDPMLAKVIAHGATREAARHRLIAALRATHIAGPTTNRAFLIRLLQDDAFAGGAATTARIGEMDLTAPAPPAWLLLAAAALLAAPHGTLGWRSHGNVDLQLKLELGGEVHPVRVTGRGRDIVVHRAGTEHHVAIHGEGRVQIDNVLRTLRMVRTDGALFIDAEGESWCVADLPLGKAEALAAIARDTVTAPMPGLVVELAVAEGDRVAPGQVLLVMEAMKMQLELKAPAAGTVAQVAAYTGQQVPARALLVRLDLDGEA